MSLYRTGGSGGVVNVSDYLIISNDSQNQKESKQTLTSFPSHGESRYCTVVSNYGACITPTKAGISWYGGQTDYINLTINKPCKLLVTPISQGAKGNIAVSGTATHTDTINDQMCIVDVTSTGTITVSWRDPTLGVSVQALT